MLYLLVLASFVALCCAQSYCPCGPSTAVDSNLGLVSLNGDSQSISDDSNCPGTVGPKDLTALKADLSPGGSYSLTYTVTTCGNVFPTVAGAWIDYNKNLAFDENEVLGAFSTAKNAVIQPFTVPTTDIQFGDTRMRVQVQEIQSPTLNPCANFPYGATKEFTIVIKKQGAGGSGAMSGGTIFILIVLIGSVVYVAVGCAFNKFARNTSGAKDTCPQGDFWFNLPANFIEGFRFTRRKICGGGGDYNKLGGGGGAVDSNDL